MKKAIIWSILFCLFVGSAIMFYCAKKVEKKLDTMLLSEKPLRGSNVISIIDTIYGRKYVVDVDTVTGNIIIVGFRNSHTEIEDSI